MQRFRVAYTKHHVELTVRPRIHEVETGEITAAKYMREGRLWLLASDLVIVSDPVLVRDETGYYVEYLVQPLDHRVHFIVLDRFHGIRFLNWLEPHEELHVKICVWRFRRRPLRLRKSPRQLFKLLDIDSFRISYVDNMIGVFTSYYMQDRICYEKLRDKLSSLVLYVRDYRLELRDILCSPPLLPLRRGEDLVLIIPECLLEVRQVYRYLGREVTLAKLDLRGHKLAMVIVKKS